MTAIALVVMIGALLLFLLAAAVFPEVPAGTECISLPAHFAHVQRRFWLLFVAHWVTMNGRKVRMPEDRAILLCLSSCTIWGDRCCMQTRKRIARPDGSIQ
jgi:hypothetical protein